MLADQEREKRRLKPVKPEAVFGDNLIAGAVAMAFTRERRFWELVEGERDPLDVASALVPCERSGRRLVVRYVERARDGLDIYARADVEVEERRMLAALGVRHMGLSMVWGEGDPPLSHRARRNDRPGARSRLPSFAQYGRDPKPGENFTSPLETLERVLARRCAVSRCPYPAQAWQAGRRASRPVCCKDHENGCKAHPSPEGVPSRLRLRRLLATAASIVSDVDEDCYDEWASDTRMRWQSGEG